MIVDAADRARRGGEVAPGPAAEPLARELILAVGPEEWDFDESFAEAVAFADAPDQGVAIAVLDDRVEDWMLASVLAAGHPRARVARRRHDDASAALDELLAGSRAEIVVVRGPNQTLTATDAARLADRVDTLPADAVVGPVWRDGDGTIAAAGAVADGRFLAGHPIEDLGAFGSATDLEVPALAGTTFAARRSRVTTALRGADAAAHLDGPAVVALDVETRTRSIAAPADLPPTLSGGDDLLSRAGWERVADGPLPRVRRPQREVDLPDGQRVPSCGGRCVRPPPSARAPRDGVTRTSPAPSRRPSGAWVRRSSSTRTPPASAPHATSTTSRSPCADPSRSRPPTSGPPCCGSSAIPTRSERPTWPASTRSSPHRRRGRGRPAARSASRSPPCCSARTRPASSRGARTRP